MPRLEIGTQIQAFVIVVGDDHFHKTGNYLSFGLVEQLRQKKAGIVLTLHNNDSLKKDVWNLNGSIGRQSLTEF
eukprot:CAMPEP_0204824058 /NCGR_PEP_ID=MMETSP1346-20131115/2113_1 /ASSEMBLY_ACC=CAM_ASM_000771 /TAXON_ID=215587 /ORGANISM="Aplanochytrium stocchinoi, Strain GSBS06" /LENGTH=73 /DNA_ID=CAMNT_0051951007 /DNA_START=208 /DNA_END=429 /DNA_ORIENTATION=-